MNRSALVSFPSILKIFPNYSDTADIHANHIFSQTYLCSHFFVAAKFSYIFRGCRVVYLNCAVPFVLVICSNLFELTKNAN